MSRRLEMSKILLETSDQARASTESNYVAPVPRVSASPIRGMSQTLSAIETRNLDLEKLLASKSQIVELDAASLDDSFVSDRLADQDDANDQELKASISRNGQEVPILVRPIGEGRYQIAYGHRRVRAMRELGLPIKAIIRPLSDLELILAQGLENSNRLNLTWIERACFARNLEARGFDVQTIYAALMIERTELSRMMNVTSHIPSPVIQAIGPAPKIGRPRWVMLADHLQDGRKLKQVEKVLTTGGFAELGSDARFERVLNAVTRPLPALQSKPIMGAGRTIATFTRSARATRLEVKDAAFAEWLAGALPDLFTTYLETPTKDNL